MKILLSVLLAAVIVHAHKEDSYHFSADGEDSLHESGSSQPSGMEESNGFDNIDVFGEPDDYNHREKEHGRDDDDENHENYDGDYHEEHNGDEWKFESHERKRRFVSPCAIGCSNCILDLYCQNCKAGYKPKGAGCTKIVPTTPPPKSNVQQKCKGIAKCLQCPFYPWIHSCQRCAPGWILHKATFDRTICTKTCPRGHQATNGKQGLQCSTITLKCPSIPGCEQCPNNTRTCEKCSGSGILHRDSSSSVVCVSKCPYSYNEVTKNGKRVCKQQAGCDDYQCNICLKTWFKADYNGRICHKQCPPGYSLIKKTKFCKKCVKGCKKCNSKGCVECNQGLSLHVKRTNIWGVKFRIVSCLWTCPPGYNRVLVKGKGYQCHKVPKRPVTGKLP